MKRLLFFCLLIATGMVLFGQSGQIEMFTRLYEASNTTVTRFGVVKQVADAKTPDAAEFYAMVLARLVEDYPNIRGNQEVAAADDMARLLALQLGDAKYIDAAGHAWLAEQAFSNPLVKSDMLIALGKMGATAFLPQVVRVLQDLNLQAPTDRQAGERVAYGAILALEYYRDLSGYLPVFFASTGWYSDRIKNQALASLPRILDDPTDPLLSVINSPGYGYDVKLQALQIEEDSWVGSDRKSIVASAALAEGWRASTADRRQRGFLASLRKLAIRMIGRYGTDNEGVPALLERSYKEGADEEEKFAAVAALAVLKTEPAVNVLVSCLMGLNEKFLSGTGSISEARANERMVRVVIPALGLTGSATAKPVLQTVLTIDWTNAVKRLAADAIGKLPQDPPQTEAQDSPQTEAAN